MRKQKIIICDTDSSYLKALCTYFLSSGLGLEIASYSVVERFLEEDRKFDVALLGKEFLNALDDCGADISRFGKIFVLTGDVNEVDEDYAVLYKFQQMKSFLGTLRQYYGIIDDMSFENNSEWTGIYSPIRHELQLLFALALCKQKQNEAPDKNLLFLDLEENSLMSELVGIQEQKNVTDYLYLLENDDITKDELLSCLAYYDSISYLPAVRYFQELVAIDGRHWRRFFASIAQLGFGQVVVLFDGSLRGMDPLFDYLKDLILLGREGDFYRKYDRQIRSFLRDQNRPMMVRETLLPLSGANLVDGTYRFDQLLSGNLSSYARRAVKEASKDGACR